MKKILFTYNDEVREGFESRNPNYTSEILDESVDEIVGENVLEKIPNLINFIDECYRIIRYGGKISFNSPYYASVRAWISPLNIRGLSEMSLNFSQKKWREENKFTEALVKSDFDVTAQFLLDEAVLLRSEEARNFQLSKYSNVVMAMMYTLTKKRRDEKA